jgi:hypothetical protein
MGVKLHGAMYKEEPWLSISKDPESIIDHIRERVPEARLFPLSEKILEGNQDRAFYFEFDKGHITPEMILMLRRITEAFAEKFSLQSLLEPSSTPRTLATSVL